MHLRDILARRGQWLPPALAWTAIVGGLLLLILGWQCHSEVQLELTRYPQPVGYEAAGKFLARKFRESMALGGENGLRRMELEQESGTWTIVAFMGFALFAGGSAWVGHRVWSRWGQPLTKRITGKPSQPGKPSQSGNSPRKVRW